MKTSRSLRNNSDLRWAPLTYLSLSDYFQGSFYAANWLILAKFDPNFVIPETSVNQVRNDLACMLGGSGRLFLTTCPAPIYFAHVRFS